MSRFSGCFVAFGLLTALAWAQDAPEAAKPKPLDTAKASVDNADWSAAIDAYTAHLRGLTTRDYRDKKTFSWILEAFEKQAQGNPPDYEAFQQIVKGKLPRNREKGDPLLVWRLHALLAEIAARQGNDPEVLKATEVAIDWYPNTTYGDPATQSRLQHLYNDAALLRAKSDPAGGETYLLDEFLRDERFDFVYLKPWQDFYNDNPEAYQDFARRVLETYDQKIKRYPAKTDLLTHYRKITEEALGTTPQ
ncbi:MAG: hypothetical protein RBU21_00620 [FCB group bacterium]|jgi:hypothetical protein|nr:hypothetical protein [FCB group bacterium]